VDARRELGATRLGPRVFRRQMEALARVGYRALGSAELLDAGESGLARSGARDEWPAVVLTFDDGYEALARYAFPVLADLDLRALVFVVTDYVGRDNDWDVHYGWRRFRHLSWDDLARWQERGIEVHSHGATHARLTWLSDAQVEDELGRSRAAIARRLGTTPAGVGYPFGAVNARVRALAAAAGYSLGFAGPGRTSRPRSGAPDRLALHRRPVYSWDAFAPPCVLREDLAGGLGMAAARIAHRFAIATSVIRRISGPGVPGGG
jgi:peptidoglycan/xylan/chitin deacetylase (PgdA/CDA1 family)